MQKSLIVITTFVVAPLAVLAQGAVTPSTEEFVFRFQPPDGTNVRQTYKLESTNN